MCFYFEDHEEDRVLTFLVVSFVAVFASDPFHLLPSLSYFRQHHKFTTRVLSRKTVITSGMEWLHIRFIISNEILFAFVFNEIFVESIHHTFIFSVYFSFLSAAWFLESYSELA